MSSQEQAIKEAKELIDLYDLEVFAKAIRRTPRGVQYWFADNSQKKPGPETQKRVHEQFELHKSGKGLAESQEAQKGQKSGAAHNGQKENYMAGDDLQNFSYAHRKVVDTNAELVNVIARVLPGNLLDQVLAPKVVEEFLREMFSGKKQMTFDELTKEVRKTLKQGNGHK